MSDFIAFNEGKNEVGANGIPTNDYFLLSTRPCPVNINAPAAGEHAPGDTLGGGVGEITGATGYGRKVFTEPSPSAGNFIFPTMTWVTGSATDWPSSVKSVVWVTTVDNSGKALGAWNLQAGGVGIDMSMINAVLNWTPGVLLRSQGEI